MYCHNCGHRNPADANFCSSCGATMNPQHAADTTIAFMPEAPTDATDEISVPLDELEEGKAILVVKKGSDAGANFVLDKDVVSCGRDSGSDIFLDDVTVSRKHAQIRREDAGFTISDLGSLNGTFLNRRRVDTEHLSNGDEIQIGKFKLIFFTAGSSQA